MFGVILALVVTVMQAYVFWRAASVPFIRRHISRRYLSALGFILWLSFFPGRLVGVEDLGTLATILELWSMLWMGMLFLTSVALLAVELATGGGFFMKEFAPKLRGAALVVGGTLAAIALVQGLRAPAIQSYDVSIEGLPEGLNGFVIVALSDLHLGQLLGERWLSARIEQVQAERPDVVVLLGDVFEGHGAPNNELLATLHHLSAPQGIWGVLGNHESHDAGNDNTATFATAGVQLLRNTRVRLASGLVLAGVDDLSANDDAGKAGAFLTTALAGRPSGTTVLLSHAPLSADLLAGRGIDLMLSGHTHGGQLWPFGYLVRQRFPLFEGRYAFGTTTAIVSRGTGTWGPPMRLWHRAEILRITLRSGAM